MKAAQLLNAHSTLSMRLDHVGELIENGHDEPENIREQDSLMTALTLIDKELAYKLVDAGAEEVVKQYTSGLITLPELTRKLASITLNLQ